MVKIRLKSLQNQGSVFSKAAFSSYQNAKINSSLLYNLLFEISSCLFLRDLSTKGTEATL
ncbi:hypothetical protein LEP1GSC052_1129 [Leptospira kmetyi serovar Malaysia str. Bejo-Iso9]|nr:hypothetical protein LEP1GSC052_1129 [Leptospira kmetyi serovar Malaysia str. Bejo-Iso9]